MKKNFKKKKLHLYNNPLLYEKIIAYRFYDEEIDFINSAVNKYCNKKQTYKLLDLGGGPGKNISLLSSEKYNSFLIDKSYQMCKYAKTKYNVRSITSNFFFPPVNCKFDVIISMFNTISYILSVSQLKQLFYFISHSLNKKGIFIFSLSYFTDLEYPFEISDWSVLDDDYNEYRVKLYYDYPVDYENHTIYQKLEIKDVSEGLIYNVSSKKMFIFPLDLKILIEFLPELKIIGFYDAPYLDKKLNKTKSVFNYYVIVQKV